MMTQQRLYPVIAVTGLAMLLFSGCTTKKYVRQQTEPLINHVNDLNAQTAKNARDLKDVSSRTDQGLAQVNQSSQQAMQQAQQAQSSAQQVQGQLSQTSTQVQALDNTVANLDNYQQAYTSSVHFGFDKSNLTRKDREELDDLVSKLNQTPHSILEVQGYTDSIGPDNYNFQLSQRRADNVVRYLESKNVAPHKIFMVGLGKNQAVASNHTAAGRQENRRVDLRVMVNPLGSTGQQQQPAASPAGQAPPETSQQPQTPESQQAQPAQPQQQEQAPQQQQTPQQSQQPQ